MKKIIVCVFVLAVAIQGINAQDQPKENREKHRNRHHDNAFQHLNLTEDQKAKFKSMNDEFRKQTQDLKKNDNITVKDWKGKMETLRKDHRTQMQSILTKEQKTQLEKGKQERKSRHEESAGARMDKMKSRLNLSDDQAAQLKKNRTEMSGKMKAIRENQSLTDDQRKEQARDLKKKNSESFKKILTEEQLKRLHEKQRHRPAKLSV
ncbi:MAG: hypothetical protein ABIR18_05785 [Chitinophagaceae bacterium]